MKKALERKLVITIILLAGVLAASSALATPSTNFYTPCTPYIQPFGVPHLTYDSYFNKWVDLPADVGLTVGILPWKKFQGEVGFDLFLPGIDPAQFNFKLGIPEDALFKWSPGINAGMFGIGTETDVTNFNIAHLNIGKTIPKLGIVSVGGYWGTNTDLFVNSEGDTEDMGFMASYYRTLEPFTDRIAISGDWMSGRNWIGGGGVGLYFWMTKSIDVIMGWVWLNDPDLYPPEFRDGLFTIQVDIDFDFRKKLD